MASETILDLLQSFESLPLNTEQAERLQCIRRAASSFAAVLHQALPSSLHRERAIDAVRDSLSAATAAIGSERVVKESINRRDELLGKISDAGALTSSEFGRLAALLGVDAENAPKRAKRSR